MGVLRHWGRRFLLPFSTQSDQAIADEIRSHLSLHADELMAEGQPPGIASQRAHQPRWRRPDARSLPAWCAARLSPVSALKAE